MSALETGAGHPPTWPHFIDDRDAEHAAVDAEVAAERKGEAAPLSCCDGTGWTGNPRERCVEHYEPSGLSELSR